MILSVNYADFTAALNAVLPILKDKSLREEAQNVYCVVENDNTMSLYGFNTTVDCKAQTAIVLGEHTEDELKYFCIPTKELNKILDGVSGLSVTELSSITFDVRQTVVYMILHEKLKNEAELSDEVKAKYSAFNNQISKYKLTKGRVAENDKNRFSYFNTISAEDFVSVDTAELKKYLAELSPAVVKNKEGKYSRINFLPDLVYTTPTSHITAIANTLPTVLTNFVLSSAAALFLDSFCNLPESLASCSCMQKKEGNATILFFKTQSVFAKILTYDVSSAFNLSAMKNIPDTGLVINRNYFFDIIKRMEHAGSEIIVKIDLNPEGASKSTLVVENDSMHQTIPIMGVKGSGTFAFIIKPGTLREAILGMTSFTKVSAEFLYLFLELTDTGNTTIYLTDSMPAPSPEPTSPEWQALPEGTKKRMWFSRIASLTSPKGFTIWTK